MENKKQEVNKYVVPVILILAAISIWVFVLTPPQSTDVTPEEITNPKLQTTEIDEEIETYSFTADSNEVNAFDLLSSQVEVNYQEYDFGIFVDGLDGLMADKEHFWAFYVNGEFATKGVKQTTLQKGDLMEFKYQLIEEAKF